MNGFKCEKCFKESLGYCPFDEACQYDAMERVVQKNMKAIALERLEQSKQKEASYV
jgi:hypothetical protein